LLYGIKYVPLAIPDTATEKHAVGKAMGNVTE
jgi:hypothetical protein